MSCSFNLESVLNYITVLQWSTEEKKTLTYNLLNKIQNLSSTWVEAAETKGTAVKKHFQRLIPEIPQQLNIRIPNEGEAKGSGLNFYTSNQLKGTVQTSEHQTPETADVSDYLQLSILRWHMYGSPLGLKGLIAVGCIQMEVMRI